MDTYALFDNGTAELVIIKLLNVEVKDTLDIYFQSFRSPRVKESARRGIECAYEVIFSKDIGIYLQKMPISVTVKDFIQQVDGSSAGAAYAVAFAAALKKGNIIKASFDLPDKAAVTGEVDIAGNIKAIKYIKEKILGAINQNVELMFYPSSNSEELRELQEKDEEFDIAVKNSGIKLKGVANIRQLFCEIGILPDCFPGKECTEAEPPGCPASNNMNGVSGAGGGCDLKLAEPEVRQCRLPGRDIVKKPDIPKVLLTVISVVIIFSLCVLVYLTLEPSAMPVSGNLALNKMAYASSNENSTNSSVNAFDGNTGTRWSSEYSDNQWIYVDLGSSRPVSSVVLNWEVAYAKQYQIQVSNDETTWATVYTNNNGAGGVNTISFDTVSARYVKMYAWQRATEYGYSLWEFEVYSSKSTAPIPTLAESPAVTGTAAVRMPAVYTPDVKAEIKKPFPQNLSYTGCIKPDNVTQAQMNSEIKSYYDYWKATYVKPSNGVTPGGGYYVEIKGTSGDGNEKTVSSVHGYGMIIFAFMAGYDGQAKQCFDGMYNMYNNHRSNINSNNMSWIIDETEDTSKDSDSSTDGDMDIAYALLLAHCQWGSNGSINYLSEAKRIITEGIKKSEMSSSTMKTLLGDWSSDQNETRVGDWMTDHFRAYYAATGDSFWKDATDTVYSLISEITAKYAPNTGLVPDFIVRNPARPAQPNSIEAPMDSDYGWNSCRYPWRMATDYALYGGSDSKAACSKMITWLKSATSNNPSNIKTGYKLNGIALGSNSSIKFTAPFIAACIADSANQSYLNAGWGKISNWRERCDGDSVNLLCMLLISGNWWAPG